jgi:hypothetical protein
MVTRVQIGKLAAAVERVAAKVEERHGTFEPCEKWVLDGDEAYQPDKPDVVLTAAELEARPIPYTRTGIGRVVYVLVSPPPRGAVPN